MTEFEKNRNEIFDFLYRLCPEPLYAGYLWEIAWEQAHAKRFPPDVVDGD